MVSVKLYLFLAKVAVLRLFGLGILIMILCIFSGCGNGSNDLKSGGKPIDTTVAAVSVPVVDLLKLDTTIGGHHFKSTRISKEKYNTALKTGYNDIDKDSSRVTIGKNYIKLLLDGNQPRIYKDTLDEGMEYSVYTYLGLIRKINCFVIDLAMWEGAEDVILLNKTTGAEAELWSYFQLSPDSKAIVASCQAGETSMSGLQYLDVKAGKIDLLYTWPFDDILVPSGIVWRNNGSFYMIMQEKDNQENMGPEQYYEVDLD